MVRSPDELDFEQYYEDWRHRDNLTWQIPAVTVAIGSGVMIGSYIANIPWLIKTLTFGLVAFFIATLTVMLAQNLYYQSWDLKHLKDYGEKKANKPRSKPIPPISEEENFCKKFGRILGRRRMGSTLLLISCFSFYVGLSYMFASTWQWCTWPYWVGGIAVLLITFLLTFGCFLCWLVTIQPESSNYSFPQKDL